MGRQRARGLDGGLRLSVRTEDIARFGQLYLQKGQWQGKQLLPASWVEAATARQMSNGSSPSSDWDQGYGYQFWRSRHGFYRGDGAHGQYCLVLPQYDAVVAITSGTRDMPAVMNLVWDASSGVAQGTLPADSAAHAKLTAKLASLTLPPQTGKPGSPLAASVTGKRFTFVANPQSMDALSLDAIDAKGRRRSRSGWAGEDHRVSAAPGAWRKSALTVRGTPDPWPPAAAGRPTTPTR